MKFNKELFIQRITRDNLDKFGLELVAFEFQNHRKRFDTLANDKNSKSFVIIEYKNKFDPDVIKQCAGYYNLLSENKQDYIDKYNDVFGTELKEDDFDFDKTRVMIIGTDFTDEQILATKTPHYPFEIWKVKINEKLCISYENVVTGEIKYLQVREDDLKLTEDELLQDRSREVLELYDIIKNRVKTEFPKTTQRILIGAFSYRLNDKLICKFVFNRKSLNLYFYVDEIIDTQDWLEDISGRNLQGNTHYRFEITSKEDINYFIELFTQVYDKYYGDD